MVAKAERASVLPEAVPVPVDVVVVEPFQVVHDGIVYTPLATATVPGDIAEQWILNGWVEAV